MNLSCLATIIFFTLCAFIGAIIYGLFGYPQVLGYSLACLLLFALFLILKHFLFCVANFCLYLAELILKSFDKKEAAK